MKAWKMVKAFLLSHAGKGTVGVVLADLLIAWPDALAWMVAGVALVWAGKQFRQSFRSLSASPAVSMRAEVVDLLDQATALDMAAHAVPCPAVVVEQQVAVPAWRRLPA